MILQGFLRCFHIIFTSLVFLAFLWGLVFIGSVATVVDRSTSSSSSSVSISVRDSDSDFIAYGQHQHYHYDDQYENNNNKNNLQHQMTMQSQSPQSQQQGLKSIIYYVNWAIYARNHTPQSLPANQFTHILYAFANVRPESGEVYLTDTWSDTDKHFEGDSWNDVGTNVYGCVKQLFKLKKANRKMKVLLSVGGWTYSANFAGFAGDVGKRKKFVESVVRLLEDLGLDGVDVDWEYPKNGEEAGWFTELLAECRKGLDEAAAKRMVDSGIQSARTKFWLSAAVPAGATNYEKLDVRRMDRSLDFWNLMAYDYAGSWDQRAGHQANLFPDRADHSKCTPFNTVDAIKFYMSHGVAPSKIVLGMPLYGREFSNTNGPGHHYSGIGQGSWEQGVWDYKVLPRPGASVHHDEKTGASWSYDPTSRSMVSFDDERIAGQKAHFVKERGLGGGMWWESSGDKDVGGGSLVEAFLNGVGGERVLETSENCLSYPESKYDNIRNGME